MMNGLTEYAPETSPVVCGYLILDGLYQFINRFRIVGSNLATIEELLKDLDRFESSSESNPLGLKNTGNRMTRKLEISMNNNCWGIFYSITPLMNEEFSSEISQGYLLLFGLWSLKESMSLYPDPTEAIPDFFAKLNNKC